MCSSKEYTNMHEYFKSNVRITCVTFKFEMYMQKNEFPKHVKLKYYIEIIG